MVNKGLTKEDVFKAAKKITYEGGIPTTKSIREILGTGSLSTISKYLQEWNIQEDQNANNDFFDIAKTVEKLDGHIAEFLHNEHPQIIALILSHLEVEKTASILRSFNDSVARHILERMKSMSPVQSKYIKIIDKTLKRELEAFTSYKESCFGGSDLVKKIEIAMMKQGEVK
ncbi:MAG: DNA-binding protein [Oligoflexia bacterium]|nr:DNA-binding protein [Oligoflexia bacterium]